MRGEGELQAIEQKLDFRARAGITRQGEPTAVTGGEDDVDHLQGGHFFKNGSWGEAKGQFAQARS